MPTWMKAGASLITAIVLCGSGLLLYRLRPAVPPSPPSTFHVSGTITQCGIASSGEQVTFEGKSLRRTVKANENGVYEADLPVGVWTAAATVPPPGPGGNLSRPRRFRVTKPASVVLNIFLHPSVGCTIGIVGADKRPATQEEQDHALAFCIGEDFFPAPSADGVPFEVALGGLPRSECSTDRSYATYNLLSLQADVVLYDPGTKTLKASGDVVIEDESGEQRSNSVTFKLQDGRAVRIH